MFLVEFWNPFCISSLLRWLLCVVDKCLGQLSKPGLLGIFPTCMAGCDFIPQIFGVPNTSHGTLTIVLVMDLARRSLEGLIRE